MNVLVLGGNGYLGSKVVRRLTQSGVTVICTKRAKSDLSRLSDLIDTIRWIPSSIDAVETAAQYLKFDYVVNMACNYGKDELFYADMIDANIEFPLKVLNKVVEKGTKNYLSIGTGLPEMLNMYSFSKNMFNAFGKFYVENHGINFFSLLLEMFYGADEPRNRFLPSIINNMILGNEVNMTIGTQRRDIIHVDDIVEAVIMVMESDLRGYREIPVGTGEAPAIAEIVEYIWCATGKKSKINKGAVPMRKNEPDCIADISIISNIGNWNPTPWRQGIQQMVKEMKAKIRNI